ncbi:LD-carboxypeptidase [Archangium sp.]|uniref:LD-carboxypeptidase n=1 Tax=Archangium sp. TaxID=1872627 RepID=UPI002D4B980D|nr:LD-carboxypeptidase [Archangium sp.]HYO56722.1 LD-carboxypeptidase [Archangium sp.]
MFLDFKRAIGLRIREYPTTRASPELLARDPLARVRDIHAALAEPEVKALIASIGGEDSIRLLPHLDPELFVRHPKILTGYSDVTTLLVYGHQLGLVTYHGPAVMAGFAQAPSLPESFIAHVRALLFEPQAQTELRPYEAYSGRYADWREPANASRLQALHPDTNAAAAAQARVPGAGARHRGAGRALTKYLLASSFESKCLGDGLSEGRARGHPRTWRPGPPPRCP